MNASSELLRTAAQWFLRARGADAQSEEYTAWLAWMEADPAHRRAFEQIQETWDIARSIAPQARPRLETPTKARRISYRSHGFAIAAGVLIAMLGVMGGIETWLKPTQTAERIETARGEHQATRLPDGSHVELGGMTGVAVHFTAERRLLVADEGEAFYKVQRDPRRPFVVRSGNVLVTALGTAFSVRREANIVSIAVEDGVVEVNADAVQGKTAPVRARAGERVQIDSTQPGSVVRLTASKSAVKWEQGKLRFEGEPLRVVVASLNRYSDREIVLGDPALAELQFSGTVFEDRLAQWLDGVQHLFPIEVRNSDSGRVVLTRRSP